jgi:hypothetical protein
LIWLIKQWLCHTELVLAGFILDELFQMSYTNELVQKLGRKEVFMMFHSKSVGMILKSLKVVVLGAAVLPIGAFAQVTAVGGTSVDFGSLAMGQTSANVMVKFQIQAGTTVNDIQLGSKATRGVDFINIGQGNCTARTYTATTACSLALRFAPVAVGYRSGTVVFHDATGKALAIVYLYGVSAGAQPIYYHNAPVAPAKGVTGVDQQITPEGTSYTLGSDSNGNTAVVAWQGTGASLTAVNLVSGLPNPGGSGNAQVVVDKAGNLIVNLGTAGILRVAKTASGYSAPTTIASGYDGVMDIAVDPDFNVLLDAWSCGCIAEVPWTGTGYGVAKSIVSGMDFPWSISLDSDHNLYIADVQNYQVLKSRWQNGAYAAATPVGPTYTEPGYVGVDDSGNMYVQAGVSMYGGSPTTGYNLGLTELTVATPPVLAFATTAVGATATNSGQTVVLENNGDEALVLSQVSYPVDFPQTQPAQSSYCVAGTSLKPGDQCLIKVDFEPIDASPVIRESVSITGSSAGTKPWTQVIGVVGYARAGK